MSDPLPSVTRLPFTEIVAFALDKSNAPHFVIGWPSTAPALLIFVAIGPIEGSLDKSAVPWGFRSTISLEVKSASI